MQTTEATVIDLAVIKVLVTCINQCHDKETFEIPIKIALGKGIKEEESRFLSRTPQRVRHGIPGQREEPHRKEILRI